MSKDQEVEIKILLTEEQLKTLKEWLNCHAQFITEEKHEEIYFDNPKITFFLESPHGYKDALKYLRIRRKNNVESFFCYKNWYLDPETKKSTHCDEFETVVKDFDTLTKILDALGFSEKTYMKKIRQVYHTGDYEIVIDDVEKLGVFVEIELRNLTAHVKEGIESIYQLLRRIGIREFKKMDRGYPCMLWNLDYDFSEAMNI